MRLIEIFGGMAGGLLILGLLGCTSQWESNRSINSGLSYFQPGSGTARIPSTDKIDASCLSNPDYDSCIFLKNPEAQSGSPFTVKDRAHWAVAQTFGIKLTGLDQSGFLQNDRLIVTTNSAPRVSLKTPSTLKTSLNDGGYVDQIMAYYWINRAEDYLQNRVDELPVESHRIKVVTDDASTGWRAKDGLILLDGTSGASLSAEVLLSLWGQANLYYATNGEILDFDGDASHTECGQDLRGCCKTESGCSKALASGIGDYAALLMFPDQPALGETLTNSSQGQTLCGWHRNMTDLKTVTAGQMYSACSSKGDVYAMGAIYASIWWQVRAQADAQLIDKIFFAHLKTLKGSDDFESAKLKILPLARSMGGAAVENLFLQEFQKRGL